MKFEDLSIEVQQRLVNEFTSNWSDSKGKSIANAELAAEAAAANGALQLPVINLDTE